MTDEELVKHCMCGCMYLEAECPNCNKVTDADRIEALTAKVKLMDDLDVINGEKIEALTAELAKAVEALQAFKAFDEMPTRYKRPDVFEVSVRRKLLSTLAEIEGEKT
jgi:hypothetical protein